MASGGAGGPDHMSGELFKTMTGVNMLHVPYRGLSPALTDLLAGQVQVIFSSLPAAIEYIKNDPSSKIFVGDFWNRKFAELVI